MTLPQSIAMTGQGSAIADVLERVRNATGPDRELDKAIHCLIDPTHVAFMDAEYERVAAAVKAMGDEAWEKRGPGLRDHVNTSPQYTRQVDAAIKLIPAPYMWTMDSWSASQWSAGLWRHQSGWLFTSSVDHQFRTPALALVAAALAARSSVGEV